MNERLFEFCKSGGEINNISFAELDSFVRDFRNSTTDRRIWKLIEEHPLDIESISRIKYGHNWKVTYDSCNDDAFVLFPRKHIQLPLCYGGVVGHSGNEIEVVGYNYHVAFFHELTHVHYDIVQKGELLDGKNIPEPTRTENRLITEWLARKSRDNPSLLCHAINLFELRRMGIHSDGFSEFPLIYDYSSFWAFYIDDFEKQETFSFNG